MKIDVYSLDGKVAKHALLPAAFATPVRADLIKRAVLSEESRLYQPKGAYRWAGLETSARYKGRKEDFGAVKNKGIPHLPHEVLPGGQLGKVKRVPHAFKGRRAHPPKPSKILIEKMNRKEYAKALASALAAVAQTSLVSARHKIEVPHAPFIIEDSIENLHKTKDVLQLISHLRLLSVLERSKSRGSKSILFVVSDSSKLRGARNLPGADVVSVSGLQVRHLAPGTLPGRLTVFSEKALHAIKERLESGSKSTSTLHPPPSTPSTTIKPPVSSPPSTRSIQGEN